jgi:hypothetical protein
MFGSEPLIGAAVAAFLLAAWVSWMVCRRIVRAGFFFLYFLVGIGVAVVGSVWLHGEPLPWPLLIFAALAFAWSTSLLRSRLARLVSTAALLLGVHALATFLPQLRELVAAPEADAAQLQNEHDSNPSGL